MNSNAIVTNSDAVFIQQAAFGVNPSGWDFDINGNGSITNADAVFIQRAVFGVFGCV
jgi:hypothetical protein